MGLVLHKTVDMQFSQLERAIEKEYKLKEPGNVCPPEVKGGLAAIEKQVDLLLDTWSQMAGKNIMADIVRGVAGLEPHLKPQSRDVAISVKKNITEMMGGYSPAKARYSSVLCLGYRVTTIGDTYTGGTADRADMEKKVGEILTAIKNAESHVAKTYTEPSMLKIFMAPEFYFRGARGGYNADFVNGTKANGLPSLVDLLRAEIGNGKYKDWLFVLGTVIVVAQSMKTACTECNGPVKFEPVPGGGGKTKAVCSKVTGHAVAERVAGAQVDNVALIMKEKLVHTIAKELVSGADFNPSPTEKDQVIIGTAKVPVVFYSAEGASDDSSKAKSDERMGGCIFTLDGITIGCEVCLDHNASSGGDGSGRLSDGAHDIQISLIPSGGMSIKKFRTVTNGVIFNVDGQTPHVQAIGLTTKKKTLTLARNHGAGLDDAWEAKSWKDMTTWVVTQAYGPSEAVGAAITAPNGAVLAYGPFQIPSTV